MHSSSLKITSDKLFCVDPPFANAETPNFNLNRKGSVPLDVLRGDQRYRYASGVADGLLASATEYNNAVRIVGMDSREHVRNKIEATERLLVAAVRQSAPLHLEHIASIVNSMAVDDYTETSELPDG